MGEVTSFTERLAAKRAGQGETSFMLCPCQADVEHPTGFYPVVHHDAAGIIVTSLVCATCEEPAYLVNGRPA